MGSITPGTRRTAALLRDPWVLAALLAGALMLTASLVYAAIRIHQASASLPRQAGIPASVPTSIADLMQLSPVPARAAPGFTLTDQTGHAVSLASYRGHVVVVEFMDPHCTDICPIVSREFIDAYHDLGKLASRVVFIAVNVNQYHLRVQDVARFSSDQQLTTIPSWHFLTGPYPSLRTVWRAYGVEVYAPGRNADIVHSALMYFIDPNGRERFLASPMVDHRARGTSYLPANQLTDWGRGIALTARHLLHKGIVARGAKPRTWVHGHRAVPGGLAEISTRHCP